MRFTAPGVNRAVRVRPGQRVPLRFQVPAGGAWTLHFRAGGFGYVGDRAVGVQAPQISFSQ
jgi:hypothetical protein